MARPFIMIKKNGEIEYAYLYTDVKDDEDGGRHKAELVRYLGRLDVLVEALNSVLLKREERPLPRNQRKKTTTRRKGRTK